MNNPPSKLTHKQLLVFFAVIRNGQFSEAALDLDLTQSAVSQAIEAMERTLRVSLFERGRFGARPTAVALIILPAVIQALEALQAVNHLQSIDKPVIGKLRLVSFRSAAANILAPIIAEFIAQHPEAKIELRSTEEGPGWIERAILEGHADMALTALPITSELMTWPIGQDEFVIVSSPKRRAQLATWENLARDRLILCGVDCSPAVLRHLSEYKCSPPTSENVQEESVVLAMVASGLGYTILPRLALANDQVKFHYSPLPVKLYRQIGVGIRRQAVQQPLLSEFLSFLLQKISLKNLPVIQEGILLMD